MNPTAGSCMLRPVEPMAANTSAVSGRVMSARRAGR